MSNLSQNLTAREILNFAKMSSDSYQDETTIEKEYGTMYRVIVKDTPKYNGQCVLLFDDTQKIQYVVNRGSWNLENWIKDGQYTKRLDNKTGIYIHDGFLDTSVEIYNCILPDLNKGYSTYLTGHSLGGAITVILHLYLLADGFPVTQSVTFGQPMVTNYDGVCKYRGIPLLRVVNKKDLVPLLPPLTTISSESGVYRHFGEETILLRDNYYCNLNENSAEDTAVSDFWGNLLKGEASILDHSFLDYVSNLKNKQDEVIQVSYSDREKYLD